MRHIRILTYAVGLVAAYAALGCGSKPTAEQTSGTSGGTQPNATKSENTPKGLFADMPAEAYPKYGPEGGIERAKARKWMNDHLVGRTVEWTATVKEVAISGDDPFKVVLVTSGDRLFPKGFANGFASPTFFLGGQECQVVIETPESGTEQPFTSCRIPYPSCSLAEANKLRELKGKTVSFRARIDTTDVGNSHVEDANGKKFDRVGLLLKVSYPSIDGFLPEASKPKEPKKSPAEAPKALSPESRP
jgi:hypothetical protein